jgi:hypothetical protein
MQCELKRYVIVNEKNQFHRGGSYFSPTKFNTAKLYRKKGKAASKARVFPDTNNFKTLEIKEVSICIIN